MVEAGGGRVEGLGDYAAVPVDAPAGTAAEPPGGWRRQTQFGGRLWAIGASISGSVMLLFAAAATVAWLSHGAPLQFEPKRAEAQQKFPWHFPQALLPDPPASPAEEGEQAPAAQAQPQQPLAELPDTAIGDGVDLMYEIGTHVPDVPDLGACMGRCALAPACLGWTYVYDQTLKPGVPECWLKGGMLMKRLAKEGLTSGMLEGRPPAAKPGTSHYPLNVQALRREPRGYNCQASPPPGVWHHDPAGLPAQVKVLTFNLFWWSLFDQGRAGELHHYRSTQGNHAIAVLANAGPHDFMGFQECDDLDWMLRIAGLSQEYVAIRGDQSLCMAYRPAAWDLLAQGQATMGEDRRWEYWGRRDAQWMRLMHKQTKKAAFFMNHHGPLPINTGGSCGGGAVAFNLLQTIALNARNGDAVILVGDFNANPASPTVRTLTQRLTKAYTGVKDGGIDNIFTNLGPGSTLGAANLGGGGSDHDALSVSLRI